MNTISKEVSPTETATDFDRVKELKAFDATKAGVKGLVDAGIKNIPKIFIRPPGELAEELTFSKSELQVPVIDLSGCDRDERRKDIVDQIRRASEEWGFFILVNHGVPTRVLDSMIDGIRMFHEQDPEVKMKLYTRDFSKRVGFGSNPDLYISQFACWRDTLILSLLLPDLLAPDQVPAVCREIAFEYINHVSELADILFELLSEALGLKKDHLKSLECTKGFRRLICQYYPACPEPELTLGGANHRDANFITVLIQDQIGGLQVLHQNQWVDVPTLAGSVVVNIGDLLQMVTNDKFKSVQHRILANYVGPRISVACSFSASTDSPTVFGPIKELISEISPRLYTDFTVSDFLANIYSAPLDKPGRFDRYRISS